MRDLKTIKINGKNHTITKIKYRDYPSIFQSIGKLFPKILPLLEKPIKEMEEDDLFDLLKNLPFMVADTHQELTGFISVCSRLEVNVIEDLDIETVIDIITAIIETNNIKTLWEKVKNLGKVYQGIN